MAKNKFFNIQTSFVLETIVSVYNVYYYYIIINMKLTRFEV